MEQAILSGRRLMNEREVAQVLAKIQLGDNRQADRLVLAYWVESIGDLDFTDSMEAVRLHRRERPGVWLEPGHVVAGARRARMERERAARIAAPRAITPNVITLDRAEFERMTEAAIETARLMKASAPIDGRDF
jgi:hypothetical protein